MSEDLICSRCEGAIETAHQRYIKTYFDTRLHEDYKDCFDAIHRMLHAENAVHERTKRAIDAALRAMESAANDLGKAFDRAEESNMLSFQIVSHARKTLRDALAELRRAGVVK